MRATLLSLLAAAGLLGGLLGTTPGAVLAQNDVAKEARLAALDGRFDDAKSLLAGAPEGIQKDATLRMQLGDMASKWAVRKQGPEKVPGLVFARDQFAAAAEIQPDNLDAATSAVETALQLIDIQVEAKQPELAKELAGFAVRIGEGVLKGGANTVDLRLAVAKAHDQRAKLSHKIQDFDSIVVDYDRGAELLLSCAEESKKPAEALGHAARLYLDLARFVAEGRPIDEETRDEEALEKAIDAATKACEQKDASQEQFTIHLLVLREIYRTKLAGDFGKPYMQELGKKDGVDGLDLFLPKSDGWETSKHADWDMVINRRLEGDDTAVQIMIRGYSHSEQWGGKAYDRVEDIVKARFDSQKTDDFSEVVKEEPPEQLDTGKKGPEIWKYRLAGTMSGRRVRLMEWYFMRSKKDGKTFRIRIIDWRNSPDLDEPDVVEFVNRAFGLGQADEDDKGKKPKKPKKKK